MKYVVHTITRTSQQQVPYPLLAVEPTQAGLLEWGKENLYFSSRLSPKNLLTELTQAVKEAKEVIAFQTLLLDDSPFTQELERAVKERGVRVYGVLAAEPLRKLAEEGEEHRYEGQFRELIRRLSPLMPLRISSRIHAKYLLIDPHLPSGRAFFLTANLTQKALSENIEIGKVLEGRELRLLFEYFLYTFWEWAEEEFNEDGISTQNRPLQKYRLPSPGKVVCSLANGESYPLHQAFQEIIQKAKRHIALSTFLIAGTEREPVHSLLQSLQEAVKRGVEVELFYRFHERTYQSQIFPLLRSLVDAGVKVYLVKSPLLHAKFLLSDGKRGWLTTANLESDKAKDTMDLGWELSVDEVEVMEEYVAWLRSQASYMLSPSLTVQQLKDRTFYQVAKGELQAMKVEERITQEQPETLQRVEDLIDFYNESNHRYAEKELEDLERRSEKYALMFELKRLGRIPVLEKKSYEVVKEELAFRVVAFSDSEKKPGEAKAVLLRTDVFDPKRDLDGLREYANLPLYAE